ncbi:hypothetical protein MBLNU457_5197t1 [Dothideomycetes sp. NU457]
MWRRTYLALVLLRLYFALSPSYLHPDEHFQGPEVIASHIYGYKPNLTWEFTSDHPIRSIFPLWIAYGWPLTLLEWLSEGFGYESVSPTVVFYALRIVMFTGNFVLEDWALYELLPNPRQRRVGILLVASSYVTWTWQNHTFSNSIETLILLWCLVLVQRIKDDSDRGTPRLTTCAILAFLAVLGTFNRITFPAFLMIPLLFLLPHLYQRPLSLLVTLISALSTLLLAITIDTQWYTAGKATDLTSFIRSAVFTPWNNLAYNFDPRNLAQHGVHPYYQHIVINLPQLLGPATILLIFHFRPTMHLFSALFGTLILSCFNHQEARFLLPTIPLILSSVDLPRRFTKPFIASWWIFNLALGILMGVYHQGGIVSAQLWLSQHQQQNITQTFWWKTQMPPSYLLGKRAKDVVVHDLMGRPGKDVTAAVLAHVTCGTNDSVVIAPGSAPLFDQFLRKAIGTEKFTFKQLWWYDNHLNLDDMDFEEDGVGGTLARVVGRRGLQIWGIHRHC